MPAPLLLVHGHRQTTKRSYGPGEVVQSTRHQTLAVLSLPTASVKGSSVTQLESSNLRKSSKLILSQLCENLMV